MLQTRKTVQEFLFRPPARVFRMPFAMDRTLYAGVIAILRISRSELNIRPLGPDIEITARFSGDGTPIQIGGEYDPINAGQALLRRSPMGFRSHVLREGLKGCQALGRT
jgi:hypothetical protein